MKMIGAARNVEAWTWGGALSADYALTDTLKLSSALSYVRGRSDTDDTDLPQLPRRLGLAWDNRARRAGLLGRFVAEQDRFALNEGNIVGRDLGGSPFMPVSASPLRPTRRPSSNAMIRPCRSGVARSGSGALMVGISVRAWLI